MLTSRTLAPVVHKSLMSAVRQAAQVNKQAATVAPQPGRLSTMATQILANLTPRSRDILHQQTRYETLVWKPGASLERSQPSQTRLKTNPYCQRTAL